MDDVAGRDHGWTEADRLSALQSYGILDTHAEPGFDEIARLAGLICDTPIALVTFVDSRRQWFKAEVGLGARETPRCQSICATAMLQDDLFVVPDTLLDPRFADNPLVLGPPKLRFYAGAPLVTPKGLPLGSLCVLDPVPRPHGLTERQSFALRALARQVMVQMELRQLNGSLEHDVQARTAALEEALNLARTEARERENTEAQLRQVQKMEAVGQLTGGIAHDFNNLLAAISGSLERIQLRISQGRAEEATRHLAASRAAIERAAALTHRLLAFARRQALDPRSVDIGELVEGMADLLRRTLGPAVRVEIIGVPAWPVLCDPNQLESAILNLCINARDAMPGGGRLTLAIRSFTGQPVGDGAPGDWVRLKVSDSGSGMPPEVMARAFDPFFTTKAPGQGTGLGLSMLYGFVHQSDGQVKLESVPGRGTTVTLDLPRYHGVAKTKPVSRALPPPAARDQETILVVEDEPTVRSLVTETLEELGYRVIQAEDGPTGLEALRLHQHFDLLISDVGLPGLDGRQLAEIAREKHPGLRVLLITGYAAQRAAANTPLLPGAEMLSKPFSLEALASRVRTMLADDAPPVLAAR